MVPTQPQCLVLGSLNSCLVLDLFAISYSLGVFERSPARRRGCSSVAPITSSAGTPITEGCPRSLTFFSDEERALPAVGRGSACGATEGSSKGLPGPRGAEAEAARARCGVVPPRQRLPVPAELTDSNPGLPQPLPASRTRAAEGPGSAAGPPPALARLPRAGAPLPAAVPPRGGGSGRLRPHLWRSGGGSARGRRRRVGARRHHDGGCAAGRQGEGQILPPRGRRRPGLHPARRGGGGGGGGRGQRGGPAAGGAAGGGGGGGGRWVQEGAVRRPARLLRAAALAAGSRQTALREAPEEVRKECREGSAEGLSLLGGWPARISSSLFCSLWSVSTCGILRPLAQFPVPHGRGHRAIAAFSGLNLRLGSEKPLGPTAVSPCTRPFPKLSPLL